MAEPSGHVRVHVLFFAAVREIVGQRATWLELPRGSPVAAVFDDLQKIHPELNSLRSSTTFAVDRSVVSASFPLEDDAEVALLQPVNGGAR